MLKKAKKSIVGVFSNVSLKITGGTQNKVKLQPEFAVSLHEKSSLARKYMQNASKFVQTRQLSSSIRYKTI